MSAGDSLVSAINAALADPNVRASIRQMHAQGYPLVKMVQDLGLEDEMTPRIRQILEELSPIVVEDIRQATVEMLDGTHYQMPLNCMIASQGLESGTPVEVNVAPVDGRQTICVMALPPGAYTCGGCGADLAREHHRHGCKWINL